MNNKFLILVFLIFAVFSCGCNFKQSTSSKSSVSTKKTLETKNSVPQSYEEWVAQNGQPQNSKKSGSASTTAQPKYASVEEFAVAMDKIRGKNNYNIVGHHRYDAGFDSFILKKYGESFEGVYTHKNETMRSSLIGDTLVLNGIIGGKNLSRKVGAEQCKAYKFNLFAASNYPAMQMFYWDRDLNTGEFQDDLNNYVMSNSLTSRNGFSCRMLTLKQDDSDDSMSMCISEQYGIAIQVKAGDAELNITKVK